MTPIAGHRGLREAALALDIDKNRFDFDMDGRQADGTSPPQQVGRSERALPGGGDDSGPGTPGDGDAQWCRFTAPPPGRAFGPFQGPCPFG